MRDFNVFAKMDFLTYVKLVDDIVNEFFDDNGGYFPHIAEAYVMRKFYDYCVECADLDDKINLAESDIDVINTLSHDELFMSEFNKAINVTAFDFDFGNAYNDALKIIEDKRSSAKRIVEMLTKSMNDIIDSIAPMMTDEVVEAAKAITKNLTDGKPLSKAIVEDYRNTILNRQKQGD